MLEFAVSPYYVVYVFAISLLSIPCIVSLALLIPMDISQDVNDLQQVFKRQADVNLDEGPCPLAVSGWLANTTNHSTRTLFASRS